MRHRNAMGRGALWSCSLFFLVVVLHGGVRIHRGCVIDSPFYEIVNGPAMLFAVIRPNEIIAPELVGYPSPEGARRIGERERRFSPTLFLSLAFGVYAILGMGLGLLVSAVKATPLKTNRRL